MTTCNLCPRECNIDRSEQKGFCGCNSTISVAKTMLHHWEEPCISGTNGSGAIFFSGCTLKCVYCQNKDISRSQTGEQMSVNALAETMLRLQNMGAHNINLVTPTHYTTEIIKALDIAKPKLNIPIVYNTSGYEKTQTLKMLDGYIDVYLPDFKYFDSEISSRYSKAPDYFENASKAIVEMHRQVGKYTENKKGLIKKGVIVRHLVLPKCRHDSVRILEELAKLLPTDEIKLSLMSQFTPDFADCEFKELQRRITSFEYNFVLEKAIALGFDGFFQEKESANKKYTPDF